jgi:leucyl aminopeptidase
MLTEIFPSTSYLENGKFIMKITFSPPSQSQSGTLVVGVLEGGEMLFTTAALDKKSGGAVSRAMKASRFKGERGQWLSLLAPSNLPLNRLVLLGIGKAEDIDDKRLQVAGGRIASGLAMKGESTVRVVVDAIKKSSIRTSDMAAQLAFGALLRSYRFGKYRTKDKPKDKPSLKTLMIQVKGHDAARKLLRPWRKL